MGAERMGWQGVPAVQTVDNANYSLLTALKYNLERVIALLDAAGLSGSTGNNMLLQSLSEMGATQDGLSAMIRVEQLARINGDEALAQQITQIIATGDGSTSTYLQSEPPTSPPYTLVIGDLWFDSNDNFKLYRWGGGSWVSVADQRIASNTAAISTEETVRIDGDEALAQRIDAMLVTVEDGDELLQANIYEESTVRADEDEALALQISTLTSTVTTNNTVTTARISTEEQARATSDAAMTLRIESAESAIDTNADGIEDANAQILIEETTRANADGAATIRMNTMQSSINTNTGNIASNLARIKTEETTRATADGALALRITTLESTSGSNSDEVDELEGRIAIEEEARADGDEALASRITTVEASATKNAGDIVVTNAAIVTEQTARANADNALATSIQTVSTTVGGHTSSISQISTALNGIYAEYTLSVAAGGIITGIELISGQGRSDFIVKADKFRIENATGIPFEVIGGITYIRNAIIQEAAIGTVKLQENATFDFDFSLGEYGGARPSTAMYTWYPMGYGIGAEQRITVIAGNGVSQVVNIATSSIIKGSGSNPDLLYFRVVRLNDNKVLQTYGPMSVRDNQLHTYAFEFYDQGLIANTPMTYELQYYRSDGGPSYWYTSSMRGVVYKR